MTLYTIPEAAAALHVPEGWLRKKVSAREVPHTRLGKHVRFTDAHLAAIVDAGEQPPLTVPLPAGISGGRGAGPLDSFSAPWWGTMLREGCS